MLLPDPSRQPFPRQAERSSHRALSEVPRPVPSAYRVLSEWQGSLLHRPVKKRQAHPASSRRKPGQPYCIRPGMLSWQLLQPFHNGLLLKPVYSASCWKDLTFLLWNDHRLSGLHRPVLLPCCLRLRLSYAQMFRFLYSNCRAHPVRWPYFW